VTAWTTEAHLLASLIDAVNHNTHTLRALNVKKPGKPPKPVPRPGVKQTQAKPDMSGIPVYDLTGGDGNGDDR
jgi:hypothetical protein